MRVHIVRQGETLTTIALRAGIPAEKIWEHEKNQALRTIRPNPNVLSPGDVMYIPDEEKRTLNLAAGQKNKYTVELPTVHLNMTVPTHAGEPFVVRTPTGQIVEGTAGGNGQIQAEVGPLIRQVTLSFPKSMVEWQVAIGSLDPASVTSGARARLVNLGYILPMEEAFGWDAAEALESSIQPLPRAISAFQKDQGLPITGSLDEGTSKALVKAHGS